MDKQYKVSEYDTLLDRFYSAKGFGDRQFGLVKKFNLTANELFKIRSGCLRQFCFTVAVFRLTYGLAIKNVRKPQTDWPFDVPGRMREIANCGKRCSYDYFNAFLWLNRVDEAGHDQLCDIMASVKKGFEEKPGMGVKDFNVNIPTKKKTGELINNE